MSVLVVDKPRGPSSFDVVRQVRRELRRALEQKGRKREGRDLKIGHGGTLDPMATGVLPICVGEATKLAPFLLDATKEYDAELRLGVETDTLDATGTETVRAEVPRLAELQVIATLQAMLGVQTQVPPMFSALKRDGRPLYSYARAGETVERQPRRIELFSMSLLDLTSQTVVFRVHCSKGTYVRVLAADVARRLGTVGHLAELRRTASGPFRIAQAATLESICERIRDDAPLPYVGLAEALSHLPRIELDADLAAGIRSGRKVMWGDLGCPDQPAGSVALTERGAGLVAVAAAGEDAGRAYMLRVFNPDRLSQ